MTYVHGTFNVEKCVKYLLSVGAEITDEQAAQWRDAEKTERFFRSLKGRAAEGWDWWCKQGHQNYVESKRGQRRKGRPQPACRTCGGGLVSGHVRWVRLRDGALRDYRAPEDRWRPLDWLPAPHGDEPPRFMLGGDND